jgi:hypothetical protein
MQSITEQIARNAVEQNGGEYATDVPDLLKLFSPAATERPRPP